MERWSGKNLIFSNIVRDGDLDLRVCGFLIKRGELSLLNLIGDREAAVNHQCPRSENEKDQASDEEGKGPFTRVRGQGATHVQEQPS